MCVCMYGLFNLHMYVNVSIYRIILIMRIATLDLMYNSYYFALGVGGTNLR